MNTDITKDEVFFKLKKTTIDTTLRWAQYRVLHPTLTSNKMVAKYNLDQKENCTFWDRYPESIEHLFVVDGIVIVTTTISMTVTNAICIDYVRITIIITYKTIVILYVVSISILSSFVVLLLFYYYSYCLF